MCYTQPGESATATAGATTQISVELPPAVLEGREMQPYVTQSVVAVHESITDTTTTASGPVYAQLYMVRSGAPRLLDDGAIIGGYGVGRCVVGTIGPIAYTAGDRLVAIIQNASAADVQLDLAYATDYAEPQDIGCESYTKLSTVHAVLAEMDVTYTQANAAGGAVVVDITPATGSTLELLSLQINNSGTNTIQVDRVSGTTSLNRYANIASGAATSARLPSPGAAANTTNNIAASAGPPITVTGPTLLTCQQTGAGAQNDTFTIRAQIRMEGTMPTVVKTRSTNQANVSATAGAASFTAVGVLR